MTTLTIVRGLPGAGKTTYAQTLEGNHFEADDFMIINGEYKFDFRLLEAAHDWCWSSTVKSLRERNNTIVSNTFTQLWEIDRYLSIPNMLPGESIDITVVEVRTQFSNIHNVPEDKLKVMATRWQQLPDDFQYIVKRIV